ncbi:hypothetical protein LTR53_000177 [Teratosphaeriaceae sp. CCFEE 6253]|nr:hypothetical protein LTR53_000177 [Teratosphaeriaceae sp. CCFEE 6253]
MADGATQDKLREKQTFYANLHAALDDSDQEPDHGREASIKVLRNASKIKSNTPSKPSSAGIPRSVSDTNLAKDPMRHVHDRTQFQRPATSSGRAPPALTKSATVTGVPVDTPATAAPVTAIPRMAKSSLKRKRDGTIELVPEALQVFKGFHFYFFPNDDKNPARAMRMLKAIEYGATWQRDWNDNVTHVIADKMYDYATLLKFLKLDRLPEKVVVVAENYPSDCIGVRTVLNPQHRRFHVKSHPQPNEPKQLFQVAATPPLEQHRSLELKPAGPSVMARPPESPRTTDEATSSQINVVPATKAVRRVHREDIEPAQTAVLAENKPHDIESNEELDAAIRQARELHYLPLDDDADTSRPSSSEGIGGGNEMAAEEKQQPGLELTKQPSKRKAKVISTQDKFQCMQKYTAGTSDSPNVATIAILQQMADYYGNTGDEWRIRAYRKAMATLRNHPTKVTTRAEALALPQIGERLALKIEEIATTNHLRRLDNAKAEPTDQTLQAFMQVYGAGFAKASEWVAQGYRTLDELLEKADLTQNQRIGIEHYEDFNSRIPRVEVEQHGATIRQALQKIDPTFEVIVGGSYRRGASSSGDIDCLITRPDTGAAHLRAVVLEQLIPALTASGFLVASLAATSKDDGSKWHGASCLPTSKVWRRMDLLLVPSDELGAAKIYFTGNDIFSTYRPHHMAVDGCLLTVLDRSLRLLASKKQMRLNQRGLYRDCIRGYNRDKISEGQLVEGKDEKKIFEALGVPWRPPEHRIC